MEGIGVSKIQESGENYLETILILRSRNKEVRSIDIARELGFAKPSISRAVGILKQNGYITIDGNGYILLTESGEELAEKIYDRHKTLTTYLIQIGVDADTAEKDACRIEHILSDITFEKIKAESERFEQIK